MKIVVLDGYVANPGDMSWDGLAALGEQKIYDRTAPDEVIGRIGDADIVITNKVEITADIMDAAKNLKYIGVLATGYNIVDTGAAKARGITVTNIPDYSTDSVAQAVFALLLEMCSSVGIHSNAVKKGHWAECADFSFRKTPIIGLAGKTLGILGFGNIGRAVACIALGFGMKVLVYTRTRRMELPGDNMAYADTLDNLLAQSDILTLHAPLTDETKHIINAASIAKMKDGAMLVNTARGQLVNERDLAEALDARKIYMAGLDVLEQEPPDANNLLVGNKHTVITPHMAWAADDARRRLIDIAVDNVRAFLGGQQKNTV